MTLRLPVFTACLLGAMAVNMPIEAKLYNTHKAKETQVDQSFGTEPPAAVPKTKKKQSSQTQTSVEEKVNQGMEGLSVDVKPYIKDLGANCAGEWSKQRCMVSLSTLNRDTVVLYADALLASLGEKQSETPKEVLKEHCAASTAALKVDVPAYAMRSAMTECVNKIVDLTDATGVKPNVTLYQMMVGSVLCLQGSDQCVAIDQQLQSVK